MLWIISKEVNFLPPTFGQDYFVMGTVYGGFLTCFAFPLAMSFWTNRRLLNFPSSRRRSLPSVVATDFDKLQQIMFDPPLYEVLKTRCVRAWCIENLIFFRRVVEFKRAYAGMTPEERKTTVLEICNNHIKVGSNLEVNLDMSCREEISEKLNAEDYGEKIFDEALRTVFTMLRFGVYREFSKHPQFLKKFPADESLSVYPLPLLSFPTKKKNEGLTFLFFFFLISHRIQRESSEKTEHMEVSTL